MVLLQIQEPIPKQENKDSQALVVGIDLGTTNSLIGIFENEKLTIFSDENGDDMIASKVTYNEDGEVVGVGKNASGKYQISSIKRLMGKNYSELKKLSSSKNFYDGLIIDNTENKGAIALQIGNKKISAIEISAEILKYLKKIAEKNLQKTVTKAVITVPAYFDENAKNATKQSAELAGLEVLRLVNEPTAGAFAYGLENQSHGTYLVYDLGGGTFDVSILKIERGVFKVLGVAGDNNLGGDDFDEILHEKGIKNPREVKEKLSSQDFFENISRQEFENLISEKINKTLTLTTDLIDDLEIEISQIDGVILIGGSTRIPLIQKKLAEIFGAKKILTNLDPDRVVAIGATHQAYNLSHSKNNLLLDVNPLSLGIEIMGGIVDKIIYRNSTIPISKAKEFTTYADNQSAMKFHIVQGEREFAKDCRSLAEFEVKNIPPLKAGIARVRVVFTLDADGLLTITSEEKFTGEKQEIIVRPSYGLNENDVKNILLESLKNSKTDIENRLLTEVIVEANHDIEIIKNDLKNPQFILTESERKNIELAIFDLENLTLPKNFSKNINEQREFIDQGQKQLSKIAENLILQKVNVVLKQKISGKNVDEI
jgi:molecular chaperone HscA